MDAKLVTHRILCAHLGENSTTPHDPVAVVLSEEGTTVTYLDSAGETRTASLTETVYRCLCSDDDRSVPVNRYTVADVVLPEWLSPAEWLADTTTWKWAWGSGVDTSWPEAWQRGLAGMSIACRMGAVKLLATKNFRSDFRRSLRDQIVAWLETPPETRKFASPLSPKQWDVVVDRHTALDAKRTDSHLYHRRGFLDARPRV